MTSGNSKILLTIAAVTLLASGALLPAPGITASASPRAHPATEQPAVAQARSSDPKATGQRTVQIAEARHAAEDPDPGQLHHRAIDDGSGQAIAKVLHKAGHETGPHAGPGTTPAVQLLQPPDTQMLDASAPDVSALDLSALDVPALDIHALIESLARPAPAQIDFLEIRFSPLLREPLVVSGELGYKAPGTLERHVLWPYREDTRIHGESVRIEREGAAPRSFALKRAPELRSLIDGFGALLAGDPAALGERFHIRAHGTIHAWTLELKPLEGTGGKRPPHIIIQGSGNMPRCFSIGDASATTSAAASTSTSIMLLGDAAHSALPQPPTPAAIRKRCEPG